MFEVSRSFHLHCSHVATKGDEKCRRLHGHTFEITLTCQQEHLDENGFSVDFFDFDRAISDCKEALDHRHLNDLLEHPTCENLAKTLFDLSVKTLPELRLVTVDEIGIGKVTFTGRTRI